MNPVDLILSEIAWRKGVFCRAVDFQVEGAQPFFASFATPIVSSLFSVSVSPPAVTSPSEGPIICQCPSTWRDLVGFDQ